MKKKLIIILIGIITMMGIISSKTFINDVVYEQKKSPVFVSTKKENFTTSFALEIVSYLAKQDVDEVTKKDSQFDSKYDANGDGVINIDDITYVTDYLTTEDLKTTICGKSSVLEYQVCDLNKDSKIDISDIQEYNNYFLKNSDDVELTIFDIDGNGEVNNFDLKEIEKYLAKDIIYNISKQKCVSKYIDNIRIGDINGDGIININDVDLLNMYLMQNKENADSTNDEGIVINNGDVNNDNVIDYFDVIELINYLKSDSKYLKAECIEEKNEKSNLWLIIGGATIVALFVIVVCVLIVKKNGEHTI